MSQRQAECSIVIRLIFVGWCEWVWCTRLTHYRTVCSVGMCLTATASLVHQLMCTHSPVTVCCVVVCGSPRAEGLTVAPAGRDVVDMVSFLADSEHKRRDVSSTSSARCGHYLSTLPQQTPGVVGCTAGPHHTQHSCHYQHMHVIHQWLM